MQVMFGNCAGLDVHKKFVMACRLTTEAQGRTHSEVRRFGTMTRELQALADWLADGGVTHVAMESTGVYWQPVYNILAERFEVWLVNARHIKQVPGRKTDVKDAEWLADCLRHGLLKPSFIPSAEQRDLRDLVRYRQTVVEERRRIANRLQKVLEDANLKLSAVVTDIQGVSAQAMLQALLEGEDDPKALAELARGRLRKKRAELEQALVGRLRDNHRFLLTQLLRHLEFLDEELATLQQRIETMLEALPPFQEAVERLDSIPGVDVQLATLIVAEMGVDMSRFPSAKHLTAWAGVAPGNNETGGRQRPTKTRKGNRYLKSALTQAAHAAARKRGCYLKALYHRLAARRGAKRAVMAVARTILQIAYHLIQRGDTYHDLGPDYFDRLDREHTTKRLVRRLERLGYAVNLTERELPTAA